MSCESQGWRYCWFVISSTFFFGICYTLRVQSKELLEVRRIAGLQFMFRFPLLP
jgi:bacteriorhodopsin